MRIFVAILLLFIYGSVAAQDNGQLERKAGELNKALLEKDTIVLKQLLHDKVSYGHSNGWIETKQEVVTDLMTGKLVYNKIDQSKPEIAIDGNTATLRMNADVAVDMSGKDVQMKLHILQVWVKSKKGWQLLARQSCKL